MREKERMRDMKLFLDFEFLKLSNRQSQTSREISARYLKERERETRVKERKKKRQGARDPKRKQERRQKRQR